MKTVRLGLTESRLILSLNLGNGYQEIGIPRFGKKVDVSLHIGPKGDETNRYLATVNLNSLGFTMNIKRHMGELKSIYVRTA